MGQFIELGDSDMNDKRKVNLSSANIIGQDLTLEITDICFKNINIVQSSVITFKYMHV